jgi:hydrogenase maturation protein HypF
VTRVAPPPVTTAVRVEVRGVVQGVGFRPFVWRLANRHGVRGWVRNRGGVVEIHAEAPAGALEAFAAAIEGEAPPLARVDSVRTSPAASGGADGFVVEESAAGAAGERIIPSDVATCAACLAELLDPADRRFRYPFVNCTDCGPRFTIIEALPYDRERTSMRAFPLCDACAREYSDPVDRRFHAEPVACPACGPRLSLVAADGRPRADADPVRAAARLLREGAIVAAKGLGGFQLACDATDAAPVAELRRRKARPDKPFAVMVATLEDARRWFDLTPEDERTLAGASAPIVLVRDRGRLAASVAPGHRRQGVMLPSTPLHHLLLREVGRPLVMTSGNRSDEPICIGNAEALAALGDVADCFLLHDRDIVARYDDSVVRTWRGAPAVMRRARGLAPSPLRLSREVAPTLGVGAELHASFCLADGDRAFLSQHVGDLDSEQTVEAYRAALERYRALFGIEPETVAHDLHPDFASTRLAESLRLPSVAVQHHHAHVAAVMAEHGLRGKVLGVAFDGFGLGEDGTAWGGEFLVCDDARAERVGHLRTVRQPGGDAAVRRPDRMALAHAAEAGLVDDARALLAGDLTPDEGDVVLAQVESGLASPLTSSAGRLFDAVAALAGVCRRATHDGQPAALLEQAADPSAAGEYPAVVERSGAGAIVDTRPLIAAVVTDLGAGESPGAVSMRFHRAVAAAIERVCVGERERGGPDRVCLAGGVFQNDLLLTDAVERLERNSFRVYVSREVPAGDGGLALGQVLVAQGRLEAGLAPERR